MIIRISNYIKLCFVALLRTAFSADFIPQEYRYNSNVKESNLLIYTAFSRRNFRPPALVVSAEASEANIQVIGSEEWLYTTPEDNKVVGGLITVPITIDIYANTTTDRDNLTDLVLMFVRFGFRKKLNSANIHYVDIRTGGEGTEPWSGTILYKNSVKITCRTESSYELPKELYELIEGINLDVAVKELELNI